MPTCGGVDDDRELVWGICLDVVSDIYLLLNVFRSCRQRHSTQFAWSAPPWSHPLNNTCPHPLSRYGEYHGLLLMWSSSIDLHVALAFLFFKHLVISRHKTSPCCIPALLMQQTWAQLRFIPADESTARASPEITSIIWVKYIPYRLENVWTVSAWLMKGGIWWRNWELIKCIIFRIQVSITAYAACRNDWFKSFRRVANRSRFLA